MISIAVEPLAGGWRVRSDALAGDQVFARGAAAEAAARRLAQAFAEAGESAELRIVLRDGSLAERSLWAPGLDPALKAA